jgi:hypothetical protein
MARNKFVTLHESYMRQYERGGFLVGQVFKFNDDFKSTECYKSLGDNTRQLIDDMIASGNHIRVTGIKDTSPARYPANPETSSYDVVLNLALDSGGGRYTHHVSVPGELGQAVQYAPNLLPIPDGWRRKSNVVIKPEEAEETKAPGAVDNPDRALAKQNTEIPCDPATPSPAAASYTLQYMSDLKKGPSMY